MNWIVRRAVGTGLFVTICAGVALVFTAGNRALVVDIYLLVIGAILLLALIRFARSVWRATPPSAFDAAVARARAPQPREDDAFTLDREIELSRMDGFHFHVRLRP